MGPDRILAVRSGKTVYRDGDTCLKVFVEDRPAAEIFREAMNQTVLAQAGLPVPAVREVTRIDGNWTIVSDYVKGKTLSQCLSEDPAGADGYLRLFVALQRDIHRRTSGLLCRLTDTLTETLSKAADLPPERLKAWKEQAAALPPSQHICHGDYNPTNVVVTPDGTPCLLDCPLASVGDAAFDVAATYLEWRLLEMPYAEAYRACWNDDPALAQAVAGRLPLAAAVRWVRSTWDTRRRLETFWDGEPAR